MIVLYTILIGFVVGLIARALKPGDDRMGIIATTLFGIGGALIAKYVGLAMGWYGDGDAVSFLASLAGAIVLLTVFAMVRPKKKS
ncbi:MAG TPA: GlsB/YeaQ/YmgE family stress response membrane protein [Xanthomonadaceae bacterium]